MPSSKKRSEASSKERLVYLNVYDLSEQNNVLYWCGVGIFHSGVEVYGVEYAYGGHDLELSGIFNTEPKKPPGPVEFRVSIPMGECQLSKTEVEQLTLKMGKKYKGNMYHLLQKNCNHFSNDFCKELVGKRAPNWINRLAGLAVLCHCLLPATWVPPLNTPFQMPGEDDEETVEEKTLLNAPKSDDCRNKEPTGEFSCAELSDGPTTGGTVKSKQ
eukprot:g6537.t1